MVGRYATNHDSLAAIVDDMLVHENLVDRVIEAFSRFIKRVEFDTAKNIVENKLFFEAADLWEKFSQGVGATCIEQAEMLESLLRNGGIDCQIVHADVTDVRQQALKFAFISLVHVPVNEDRWMLLDPVRKTYYDCNSSGGAWTGNGEVQFVTSADNEYTFDRYVRGEVVWRVRVDRNLPRGFRRERLRRLVEELNGVSPYGFIAPLFAEEHHERAIFFDPYAEEVLLRQGAETYRLDVADWERDSKCAWLGSRVEKVWPAIKQMRSAPPQAYADMQTKMQGEFFQRL
ncbi:hypothetical protein OKW43_001358 [Paraburkholderia sp. WC7.3g]